MRHVAVILAVCAFARPPAREGEGPGEGTAWPPQSFWDRLGGSAIAREPSPLLLRLVTLRFDGTPLHEAVAAIARKSVVPISVDPAVPEASITLPEVRISLMDALDLVLMQASPDGEIVYELLDGDSIRVRPRSGLR